MEADIQNLELVALREASIALDKHLLAICHEPLPIYRVVAHAREHVNRLLDAEMRGAA